VFDAEDGWNVGETVNLRQLDSVIAVSDRKNAVFVDPKRHGRQRNAVGVCLFQGFQFVLAQGMLTNLFDGNQLEDLFPPLSMFGVARPLEFRIIDDDGFYESVMAHVRIPCLSWKTCFRQMGEKLMRKPFQKRTILRGIRVEFDSMDRD